MNKRDIISKVKNLHLPDGQFVVFGGCPLAAYGIRDANDIDLLVTTEVANNLKAQGWKQINKGKDDKPYIKDDFEAHTSWDFSAYKPTLMSLLSTAKYIDGIPFASLYEVKKWKKAYGRPKDLKDLSLIDSYYEKRKKPFAVITICSSANFYRQAVKMQRELQTKGYKVIIPATAERMKQTRNYEVSQYKTWLNNPDDYYKKASFMRGHFKEVKRGDAVLVLNYEKHGQPNYIGANVLMEMALAFFLHKPIFILNELPDQTAYLEEIIGLNPVVLHGQINNLELIL
ncbi:MAG: hypothetical protein ACYCPS_03970 [Candidatus Saccharimonadales bacterium]